MQGYKNYIQERVEKNSQMKISTAYAWVKGNHIDDQTATECEEIGITYNKARAGYTWGYLQFVDSNEHSMFIIKNGKYFNEENFPKGREINGERNGEKNNENYLKRLSRINQNVQFPVESLFPEEENDIQKGMTLFDDSIMKSLEDTDVSRLQKEFSKLYIITYEIDQAKMVSSIKVWMPNPSNDKAYLVDDLTGFINTSPVDFTDLDMSVLENDQFDFENESPAAIDYDIFHEDDFYRENKGNNKD